jgi:hypothetical protein
MKSALPILAIFIFIKSYAQDNSPYTLTKQFIDSNKIPVNYLQPPAGFTLFYNCDSMLFLRGNFGDTIKIWTPGIEWVCDLDKFKTTLIKSQGFGKTSFVKSLFPDGGIFVANYIETRFIYRNDSLFEIENATALPAEYGNLIVKHLQGQVDDSTYKHKIDSISKAHDANSKYVPKLIFSKHMFKGNKRKIKLPRSVNFQGDEIELEKAWVENAKNCYVVRINNKEDGQKTSYAYAIDENIKFIWWEGCSQRDQ